MRRWIAAGSTIVTLLALVREGRAQDATTWQSYQAIPLGGRTATMGGAGIAFGQDGAMPLLNPAGLARVDEHHITMSATVYSLHAVEVDSINTSGSRHSRYEDPRFEEPVDLYRSQVFDTFPTTFVYSWPFGPKADEVGHKVVSLSILAPRREVSNYVGKLDFEYLGHRFFRYETFSQSYTDYHVGPSFAIDVGPARLGASLFGVYTPYTERTTYIQRSFLGAESASYVQTSSADAWSLGVVPVLGVQIQASDSFHIGASFAPSPVHVAGKLRYSEVTETNNSEGLVQDNPTFYPATKVATDTTLRSDDFTIQPPMHFAVGVGFEIPRSFALALDVHYYAAMDHTWFSGDFVTNTTQTNRENQESTRTADISVAHDAATNINLGLEVFFTDSLAGRVGAYTDFPSMTGLASNTTGDRAGSRSIKKYGGTVGLGIFFGPVDFTIGAAFLTGEGDFMGRQNILADAESADYGSYELSTVRETRLMGIITGGVSFGEAFAPVDPRLKRFETPEQIVEEPERLLDGDRKGGNLLPDTPRVSVPVPPPEAKPPEPAPPPVPPAEVPPPEPEAPEPAPEPPETPEPQP